ncbi:kinetochore-associated protein 1-like, partial [Glossina fuscipes]|uniref:Kinetochore-associated protein 1-like n=1 Tax=Glossina fuscipes TaxID=7396 RepID=A0A9C5ZN48_9MUSC
MTNTSKQLQIYECYFKLYDGSTDLNNIFDQQQYIAIKCVHELKKLGYNSSLEKFKQSDKIDILKIIWQSNANNPHALQLLANICLGFDIHVDKIWNGILKRMVKSSMHRDLNALVDVLSCYAHLLHIEGLTKAWEWILLQPFKNANQTQSAEQEDKLHKTLFRLQSCPVVHSLNLLEFAEHCLRLGKHHMAAVLMAFCKTPEQRQSIKQLIPQCNETMRQKILELEDVVLYHNGV